MSDPRRRRATTNGLESPTTPGLGSTVDTFASRIQRRLKEQEARHDQSQKEAEKRQGALLQAMTIIRKALQETCKINLGSRFSFEVEVGDRQGWPSVELNLVDSLSPDEPIDSLVIQANDCNGSGTIELSLLSGRTLGRLSMACAEGPRDLPLVLKKSVRQYLDMIAAHVLNPRPAAEVLTQQTKPIPIEEELDDLDRQLRGKDLFSDDLNAGSENIINTEDECTAPLPLHLEVD